MWPSECEIIIIIPRDTRINYNLRVSNLTSVSLSRNEWMIIEL